MPGASNPYFISVLTRPTESLETLTFSIDSSNARQNIAVSLTVTGLSSDDNEKETAIKIHDQLKDLLYNEGIAYRGVPAFTNSRPLASFRVSRSDHVVSIWSQCEYTFEITGNPTGALIEITNCPIFCTVAQAIDYAGVKGYSFNNASGNPLTDAQIGLLIKQYSAEIVSTLRNNIVT